MSKFLLPDNQYLKNLTSEKRSHLTRQAPLLFFCENPNLFIISLNKF